jgi:hypothetical protein
MLALKLQDAMFRIFPNKGLKIADFFGVAHRLCTSQEHMSILEKIAERKCGIKRQLCSTAEPAYKCCCNGAHLHPLGGVELNSAAVLHSALPSERDAS